VPLITKGFIPAQVEEENLGNQLNEVHPEKLDIVENELI